MYWERLLLFCFREFICGVTAKYPGVIDNILITAHYDNERIFYFYIIILWPAVLLYRL